MDRRPLALLSPYEELVLRQVANGGLQARSLREAEVARLKRFGLIEERQTGLGLTLAGEQRLAVLPGSAPDNTGEERSTIDRV